MDTVEEDSKGFNANLARVLSQIWRKDACSMGDFNADLIKSRTYRSTSDLLGEFMLPYPITQITFAFLTDSLVYSGIRSGWVGY